MAVSRVQAYFSSFPLKTRILFTVMVGYLLFFISLAAQRQNREFLYYALVIFAIFTLAVAYYRELRLNNTLLAGFALHMLAHFLGGVVLVGGVRLYDLRLVRLNPWIINYDNFVHAFGVFLLTYVAYNLLRPHFRFEKRFAVIQFGGLLFLVVMGIGACSEVVELAGVLWFGAASTVGDYYNNAFDLVFNALGAIAACLCIARHELRQLKK